jgi:hypothetical protein
VGEAVMPRVELVRLGTLPDDLNLKAVVRTANRVQDHFQFVVGDPINHLGQPNEDGEYKVTDLAGLMETRRQRNAAEYEVGITDSPLWEELFSGVDSASNNIVISVADTDTLLAKINKTAAAYVLVEIAAQLLTLDYRRQTLLSVEPETCAPPWHEETRSCIFDYCGNRPHTVKKLMSPKLCSECQARFESANIRESVIDACRNMVKKAVYAKVRNVLRGILGDPISRALFGGLFVFLALETLPQIGINNLMIALLLLALLLAVILKHLRRSRQNSL